jgi:hypothetical protein
MHKNRFTIDNNNVVPYDNDDDKPMTIQAAQQQINTILVRYHTASSTKESFNCAAACTKAFFLSQNLFNVRYNLTQRPHQTTLFNGNNTSKLLR